MATTRTVTFEYSEGPDEVAALLQDPVFLRYRSESAGEHNIDVQVSQEAGGVRVTVSREKEVDVPAFAKMVLGNARRAVESTLWRKDGARWTAQYTIEVGGVPVKAGGRSVLEPSARGCKYTSTFEISAKIPLIGGRIEAFVADGLDEQLRANAERNAEALTRAGGQRGPRSFIDGLREGSKEQQS
ncbi:MAG TPA: DUF2505 domain-containing protein [Polyangiales bacterium]